jgi:recombinational DNA repair ATPase RecF
MQLDDGRTIDVTQDLANKVACRAVDVDLGRDVSDEILDGTPDASRWLGLDRDSFATTVSVSQAQIMAVADAAEGLQEHMQRAAATHGADVTAAEAIARLEQFRRDAVGADTVAAKGPLRTARNRLTAAAAAHDQARQAHADFLERAAAVESSERAAQSARLRLAGAEAAVARMQAAEASARAARAAELQARHPAPPPTLAASDELAARAAAAVDGYRNRPAAVDLSGPTTDALQAELDALPQPPTGDVRPHPSVVAAQHAVSLAVQALHLLGDRPAVEPNPAPGWDAPALRELAATLGQAPLPEASDFEAQLDGLRRGSSAAARPQLLFGGACLLAIVSAGLLVAVSAPGAVAVALLAVALGAAGAWSLSRSRATADALARAEASVEPYRRARAAATERRDAALGRARASGLPEDAAAIAELADRVAAIAVQRDALIRWEARHAELQGQLLTARHDLAAALRDRGEDLAADADPAAAAATYHAACESRSALQRLADRAEALRHQLHARRAAEDAAAAARRRAHEAAERLRAVAAELEITATDAEQLCAAVEQWREERSGALQANQRALAEWQQLQALLDGGSLADLQGDAERRRQRANELAAALAAEAIALPTGVQSDEHLAALRREAQQLEREHDVARGALDAQRAALPDVAEAEEAADAAQRELERVEGLAATIDTTLGLLRAAQERVHRDLAPVLARAVLRWLPVVSGGAYVEVSVDPASLHVRVKESATGQWRDARYLSEGTREQVYLLLRVAMAEHLVSTGERAPLLLDEVTAQCDGERKRQLLDVLHAISGERQVVLFTHDDEVAAWALDSLASPQDALVRLDPRPVGAAFTIGAPSTAEPPLVPLSVD